MLNIYKYDKVCFRASKIYDWIQRKIELALIKFDDDDDPCDKFDDFCISEICKFLKQYPGFQVRCKILENSMDCQEILEDSFRQTMSIPISADETVNLQKVKVLIQGLVEITILDVKGNVLIVSDGIPFSTTQTFLLCAPVGTDLKCNISYTNCESEFICTDDFEKLEISILLCVDIQVEAVVKVAVEADYCKPRKLIDDRRCTNPCFI